MSQTFVSVYVIILANLLPRLGLNLGNDELTTTVQVLLTIGGAIWIAVRRKQAGGVTVVGKRV